jgi:hypothetical protein
LRGFVNGQQKFRYQPIEVYDLLKQVLSKAATHLLYQSWEIIYLCIQHVLIRFTECLL